MKFKSFRLFSALLLPASALTMMSCSSREESTKYNVDDDNHEEEINFSDENHSLIKEFFINKFDTLKSNELYQLDSNYEIEEQKVLNNFNNVVENLDDDEYISDLISENYAEDEIVYSFEVVEKTLTQLVSEYQNDDIELQDINFGMYIYSSLGYFVGKLSKAALQIAVTTIVLSLATAHMSIAFPVGALISLTISYLLGKTLFKVIDMLVNKIPERGINTELFHFYKKTWRWINFNVRINLHSVFIWIIQFAGGVYCKDYFVPPYLGNILVYN